LKKLQAHVLRKTATIKAQTPVVRFVVRLL